MAVRGSPCAGLGSKAPAWSPASEALEKQGQSMAAPDPQLQGSAALSMDLETNSQRGTSLFSLFLLPVANIADISVNKNPYLLTFLCTFASKQSSP